MFARPSRLYNTSRPNTHTTSLSTRERFKRVGPTDEEHHITIAFLPAMTEHAERSLKLIVTHTIQTWLMTPRMERSGKMMTGRIFVIQDEDGTERRTLVWRISGERFGFIGSNWIRLASPTRRRPGEVPTTCYKKSSIIGTEAENGTTSWSSLSSQSRTSRRTRMKWAYYWEAFTPARRESLSHSFVTHSTDF